MEATGSLSVAKLDAKDECYTLTYKITDCGTEEKAREIKAKLDEYINTLGGQTTLDDIG
jgi:hypothetical protein